jgi:PleD family two-component response regulator
MTWSSGVAAWTPRESLDAALARADGRLYEAKRTKVARAALPSGSAAAARRPRAI